MTIILTRVKLREQYIGKLEFNKFSIKFAITTHTYTTHACAITFNFVSTRFGWKNTKTSELG